MSVTKDATITGVRQVSLGVYEADIEVPDGCDYVNIDVELALKHLGSQHDQSTHGGGSGPRSLTADEVAAVDEYSKGLYGSEMGGYSVIQAHLRQGVSRYSGVDIDKDRMDKLVGTIDSAISVSRGANGKELLRGVKDAEVYFGKKVSDLSVGDVFTDKGYVSTTTSSKVANKFLEDAYGRTRKAVKLSIKTTTDTPSVSMKSAGLDDHEKEVVLPRNTSFKVVKITRGRIPKVTLEIE